MELETSLKKLSRRELQSLAKRCGVRANSKSTQIVAEMLTFCKNTLKATPVFGDLLFPKKPPTKTEDEPRASLVVFENNAFQDKADEKPDAIEDTDVKSKGVSDEMAKAYRDGKERGIWFGRMYQKLDDLEDQWKRYLAQPKRRHGSRQKENRTGPRATQSRQSKKTPGPKGRQSPRRIRKREVKRRRNRTPLSIRKKTIEKGQSQTKRHPS